MARSRWPGALACAVMGCGPALPYELKPLAGRSERIEVGYEPPAGDQPLLARGVVDFGSFQLSAKKPTTGGRFELQVAERGRAIATLVCSSRITSLLSNPEQNVRYYSCESLESSWSVYIDLSKGVAIRAQDRAGHCFLPEPPAQPTSSPIDPDSGMVTVRECGERDEYNHAAPGRLAAAIMVTGGKVVLFVPSHDPERSVILGAFLITLAVERLPFIRNAR